jgi:hypothetical protein
MNVEGEGAGGNDLTSLGNRSENASMWASAEAKLTQDRTVPKVEVTQQGLGRTGSGSGGGMTEELVTAREVGQKFVPEQKSNRMVFKRVGVGGTTPQKVSNG